MAPAIAPACGGEKNCVLAQLVLVNFPNFQSAFLVASYKLALKACISCSNHVTGCTAHSHAHICVFLCFVQTCSRLALNGFQPFPFRHVERHQSATTTAYVDVGSKIYLMCSHGPKLAGT